MTSKLDRIIAVSVELSAARKRVARLEVELDALLGNSGALHAPLVPREGTMADAVLSWIVEQGRPVTLNELHQALPNYLKPTLSMTCNRMVRRGALSRVAPSTYLGGTP